MHRMRLFSAIAILLALLTPVLAQDCQLSFGAVDSECYGPAFDRGVIPCSDDATGQVGICDYQHRCSTCMPQTSCTEFYAQGFVGCQEPRASEPTYVAASGTQQVLTGQVTSEEVSMPSQLPSLAIELAGIAAVVVCGLIVATRRKKTSKLEERHFRSLEEERKDLKKAKLQYSKAAAIALVAVGAGGVLASRPLASPTGMFAGGLSDIGTLSTRWVILALFALAIVYYAWLCHEDAKKR